MAYDETLARRIRGALAADAAITEKKMFGGVAFLRSGLMLAGVIGTSLVARVGKEHHAEALACRHAREMDFNGRPMCGYVFVDASGIRTAAQLRSWLARCERCVAALPPKVAR